MTTTARDPVAEALREWTEVFMRHSTRDIQSVIRVTGLSLSQVHSLFRLHFRSACPITDLGESLELTPAAASHMVQRMVEMGLLERVEDPADRRVRLLTLTPGGQGLVHQMMEARHQWLRRLTSVLTDEQQAEVVRALGYLVHAARATDTAETQRGVPAPAPI